MARGEQSGSREGRKWPRTGAGVLQGHEWRLMHAPTCQGVAETLRRRREAKRIHQMCVNDNIDPDKERGIDATRLQDGRHGRGRGRIA